MEFLKKLSFFLLVIGILGLFVWALYAPKQDVAQNLINATLKEQKKRSDLFYKGVTFQETEKGVKYWEIKAKTSSINNSTKIASLEGTNGTFFQKGKPVLTFIAPSAIWQMDKKQIDIYRAVGYDANSDKASIDSIIKKSKDMPTYFELPAKYKGKGRGFFFKAENLSWDINDKNLFCKNGLWLQKGNISGMAKTLTGDVALEKVIISGNPIMYISNGYPAQLQAEQFAVDSKKNELSAKNGVTLTANKIILKTERAVFDQDKNIIHLSGGVTAVHKNYKALSQNAEYAIIQEKIILTKKAKLIRGKVELTGDKVAINVKTRSFSISGKSRIVIPEDEITKESL